MVLRNYVRVYCKVVRRSIGLGNEGFFSYFKVEFSFDLVGVEVIIRID